MPTEVAVWVSLWTTLCAAGCYNPDLAPGRFQCTHSPECPEGQFCSSGHCALRESGDADLRPEDITSPSPPDMAGDPMTVAGCAQKGYALSSDVFACPGAFEAGAGLAKALCKGGYHLCGDTGADGGKLSNVRACPAGFYAMSTVGYFGRVTGGGPPRNVMSCQMGNGLKPALVGCGTEAGSVIAQADEARCFGFAFPAIIRSGLVCDAQAKDGAASWTCQAGLESAVHKPRDPNQGGVLCCKD